MPRGKPITAEQRQRVIDLVGEDKTRREISRLTGISTSAISRVAHEAGIDFDRARTAAATEARKVDLAAKRTEVSAAFLQRAAEALAAMDQTHVAFNFGGKDNTYAEREFTEPPVADKRALMSTAAAGIRAHLEIERHSAGDQGLAAVDSWLRSLTGGAE